MHNLPARLKFLCFCSSNFMRSIASPDPASNMVVITRTATDSRRPTKWCEVEDDSIVLIAIFFFFSIVWFRLCHIISYLYRIVCYTYIVVHDGKSMSYIMPFDLCFIFEIEIEIKRTTIYLLEKVFLFWTKWRGRNLINLSMQGKYNKIPRESISLEVRKCCYSIMYCQPRIEYSKKNVAIQLCDFLLFLFEIAISKRKWMSYESIVRTR